MKSLNQLRQALSHGNYRFPDPKIELEQYFTPIDIASYCVWTAYLNGEIEGKCVLDLGCGTGVFAHASELLGAALVMGLDIDRSALLCAQDVEHESAMDFVQLNVHPALLPRFCRLKFDVAITNPPFGTKQQEHADTLFVREALSVASVVYSFHLSQAHDFLCEWAKRTFPNVVVQLVARVDYKIEKTYRKHTKEAKPVKVDIMRWSHV